MSLLNLSLLNRWVKRLPPPQRHPDPALQFAWSLTQLAFLLLPLSTLLGGVGLVIAALATWRVKRSAILAQPLHWGFAGLSLLMLLSAILAHSPTDAYLGLCNFVPYFIVFAGFSALIRTPAQLRRLAWIGVLTSVLIALIGLGQMLGVWLGQQQILHVQVLWVVIDWVIDLKGTPPGRMASTFSYANVLANYLVITFVLAVGLWLECWLSRDRANDANDANAKIAQPPPNRLTVGFLSVAVGLNAIAIVLTNSRNAWAIAAGACLGYALYLGWRWLVLAVGGLVGIVLGSAFAPPPLQTSLRQIVPAFFWARLTDQLYPDRPIPTLRSTQWQFAWSLTQERPWLGWGLRNFTPLYQAKTGFLLGHPHNLPLMLMCESGIPATLLFGTLVGWIIVQGVNTLTADSADATLAQPHKVGANSDRDRRILFSFLLAFLSHTVFSLFDVTLFDARINLIGWLLLAGIWGLAHPNALSVPWFSSGSNNKQPPQAS